MNRVSCAGIILVLIAAGAAAQGIRKPVWAGQFYDADPARLAAEVDGFLASAKPAAVAGDIRALIVPHAGYVYSGRVAAYGYKLVRGGAFETVVILAPAHRVGFEGASIWPSGGFATPLGIAEIDGEGARILSTSAGFRFREDAHAEEHAVEVQIPFIQKALPDSRIIPVVMGYPSAATIEALASALAELTKTKKILVVASTDMSHFLTKKEANSLDAETADLIRGLKTNPLLRSAESGGNRMCGAAPVLAALAYAQKRGRARVDLLRYADSADAVGPEDRVVGYLAAAVSTAPAEPVNSKLSLPFILPALLAGSKQEAPSEFTLSAAEKVELLDLARKTLVSFVKDGSAAPFRTENARFTAPRGAFVTLTKKGELRGCIGFIEPVMPLHKTVQDCTVYAASEDPRFPAVTAAELKDIAVEISVLTPLRRIDDPRLVQVGKHGLVISRGERKGLLLPQVAVEFGWDREEYLAEACLKAGLPADAWRKGAEVYVFEAIVFR